MSILKGLLLLVCIDVTLLSVTSRGAPAHQNKLRQQNEVSMSEYSIRIKRDHCEPCKGHNSKEKQLQPDECPIFKNDTYIIMTQLGRKLNEIRRQLSSDEEKLINHNGADRNFKPVTISDLEDIENTGLGKHLKRKTQPERILHYSFARVILIASYLEALVNISNISQERPEFQQNITYSIYNLHVISCKVFDFTAMLSVSKIKKKVCVYLKNVTFDQKGHELDYAISIVNYSKNILERVYKDIEGLEHAACTYDCSGKKRKLQCEPEARELRNGERKKKKENKNKGKGKKNKGNKKGQNEREKRKDTVSQQSKNERRRKKNKENNNSQDVLH